MFSVVFFGFFFRLLGLSDVSAWGDEVASFYYPFHLDFVFLYESHTPFYYLLNRLWMLVFPESVISLRLFSVSVNFLLTTSMVWLLGKYRNVKAAQFFLVMWWLWPTAIIYSRQARHYGLYADLTFFILIFWQIKGEFKPFISRMLLSIYQLIHPLAVVPAFFLLLWDYLVKKETKRNFFLGSLSALPVILYYSVRFFYRGQKNVMSNISWINTTFIHFYETMLKLFGGDSHPFVIFFPVSAWNSFFLVLLVSGILLWKRPSLSSEFKKVFALFVITFFVIELSNFLGVNLRINRYWIYLVPLLLWGILQNMETEKRHDLRLGALACVLVFYNGFIFKPWQSFAWDDDNVRSFKSFLENLPPKVLVVCASRFQLDYYFNRDYADCSEQALILHKFNQDFYLFDLNGNDKYVPLVILEKGRVELHHKFNQAVFYSFVYPKGKSP